MVIFSYAYIIILGSYLLPTTLARSRKEWFHLTKNGPKDRNILENLPRYDGISLKSYPQEVKEGIFL